MGQYNKASVGQAPVTNLNGGTGYKQTDEIALLSLMANGLTKMFHEAKDEREKRLIELIQSVGKKDKFLLAQMIVYAREVMEQRTVTHRAAVELAGILDGEEWGKRFFSKRLRGKNKGGIIYRLDDMLEIAACYVALNPSPNKRTKNGEPTIRLSNAMKKGFKMALESADAYELAKYKAEGKMISLVDMVNLLHPKGSEKNGNALKLLVEGKLTQFNTAEDKQTKAGQTVASKVKAGEITKEEAVVELKEAKKTNWKELLENKKIGYLSLVRNLRNILNDAPELVDLAGSLLIDKKFVEQSLIFPHQIDLALEEILNEQFKGDVQKLRILVTYIVQAYELSVANVHALFNPESSTAIVYDTSSSMTSTRLVNSRRGVSCAEKGALIAATLAKGIGADVYRFDSYTRVMGYNQMDTVNTIKSEFLRNVNGGSTNFQSIFQTLNKRYDRIFVISDMQGSDSLVGPFTFEGLILHSAYAEYKKKYNVQPYIYSIDLGGYGTQMFKPNERIFNLAGYSASIYELAKLYETDYRAILNEVRKIVI